jgi:hypothetical protein
MSVAFYRLSVGEFQTQGALRKNNTTKKLFARSFACFASNLLARKFDTLAFVGLRFAERANLCGDLPQQLLVVALQANKRVFSLFCFGFHLYFRREGKT